MSRSPQDDVKLHRPPSSRSSIRKRTLPNAWMTRLSAKFDIYFLCKRLKAVFAVCLAVRLLHSLGVQTHCASASSADGIHETSSCRIPVSSRCRRICGAWLAPGKPRAPRLILPPRPSLFCGSISVSRCTSGNEKSNTSIEMSKSPRLLSTYRRG